MHFLTLAAVHIPEIDWGVGDSETEWGMPDSLYASFPDEVVANVCDLMEPYNGVTENPAYLEFYDQTEEIKDQYDNGTVDCMKLPGGRIIVTPYADSGIRFIIRDGKVYENGRGPVGQAKRTKRAKRIKALPDYPWKKLFPDFKAFADSWGHVDYCEKMDAYGYFVNPEGRWDWYSIGGRWPYLLLVKDTCEEYYEGSKSYKYDGYDPEVPQGYICTSAARKMDIEWQAMRDWRCRDLARSYVEHRRFFLTGKNGSDTFAERVEDGICLGGKYLYHKGETFEEYAARKGFGANGYPINANSLCSDKGWQSIDEGHWKRSGAESVAEAWRKEVADFLDSMKDEDVLVVMDCHI